MRRVDALLEPLAKWRAMKGEDASTEDASESDAPKGEATQDEAPAVRASPRSGGSGETGFYFFNAA